ncbi:MAG: hypothetical protein ACI8X5_003244 [Planctomycetota bacterium]|jgi:hypothetical protein
MLALVLTVLAMRQVERGVDHTDYFEVKLEYLSTHADDYDAIFVGSSRVHRGFVPDVFEQVMVDSGRPMRILNMGFFGLRLAACGGRTTAAANCRAQVE